MTSQSFIDQVGRKQVPVPAHTLDFDSLEELAVFAAPYAMGGRHEGKPCYDGWSPWNGGKHVDDVVKLARQGWTKGLPDALAIAEDAVSTVEAEHDMDGFKMIFDVAGSEPDIGRFMSGEPECMIDVEIVPTPMYGRVITLCASVAVSYNVKAGTINKRGAAVTALALALTDLGLAVELYAEYSHRESRWSGEYGRLRVLVKGPNDELDPSKIMFAYAHPGLFRGLILPAMHGYPADMLRRYNVGPGLGYGAIMDPIEDLPEGTIYLPGVVSTHDVPNAADLLKQHMRSLGLIETV